MLPAGEAGAGLRIWHILHFDAKNDQMWSRFFGQTWESFAEI
jgi:hypothetical protein